MGEGNQIVALKPDGLGWADRGERGAVAGYLKAPAGCNAGALAPIFVLVRFYQSIIAELAR